MEGGANQTLLNPVEPSRTRCDTRQRRGNGSDIPGTRPGTGLEQFPPTPPRRFVTGNSVAILSKKKEDDDRKEEEEVSMASNGFSWVLLGFTGFYRVFLRSNGIYRVFYLGLLGFYEFDWV